MEGVAAEGDIAQLRVTHTDMITAIGYEADGLLANLLGIIVGCGQCLEGAAEVELIVHRTRESDEVGRTVC